MVAWVILIVIAFGFPYRPSYNPVAVGVFSAMPWSLLAKGVQDLAAATDGGWAGGCRAAAADSSVAAAACQPEPAVDSVLPAPQTLPLQAGTAASPGQTATPTASAIAPCHLACTCLAATGRGTV